MSGLWFLVLILFVIFFDANIREGAEISGGIVKSLGIKYYDDKVMVRP